MKNEKKIWNFFPNIFFGVEKSKFANRLKRALPKFRGDRSGGRGVNGRSKFVAASAGRAERKQLEVNALSHFCSFESICICRLVLHSIRFCPCYYSLPSNISRKLPAHPPLDKRLGGSRRPSSRSTNRFFAIFWSHGPQNRCIWSKISRGKWFWRWKMPIPSKIQENDEKLISETQKNRFFSKSFFRRFGGRQGS